MYNIPRVGVGVVISKNGKVLLGKRKSEHGLGQWGFPGGHLEFGETPEECARRETFEETGLIVTNIRPLTYTNDFFTQTNRHYVTLIMAAEYTAGNPRVCEPDKCERWEWFLWDQLPQPLFLPIQSLIERGFTL